MGKRLRTKLKKARRDKATAYKKGVRKKHKRSVETSTKAKYRKNNRA